MEDVFGKGPDDAAPIDESTTVPDARVRRVHDLLLSLMKAKRAFDMYPSNNPLLVKFRDELDGRFREILSEDGRLSLLIRPQEILYMGAQVYQNPEKEDNLALMFYKDGLRELTFTDGFAEEELGDFIDVIRARPASSTLRFDDDVVTLLWEKDFTHVLYYVVEEFVEGSALADDEMKDILSKERITSEGSIADAYQDAISESGGEIFSPLETISMGFRGVFSLGEEEVNYLKSEMEALDDERFLESAIYGLFESLYLDKGTPSFGVLMDNLDSAIGYLIHKGGFAMAALILERFRELEMDARSFTQAELGRVRRSVSLPFDEERLRDMAEILNGRSGAVDEAGFAKFLSRLGRDTLIPLSGLLGDVKDPSLRKIIMDALVALGRGNLDVLAAGLKSGKPSVVRDVATILGRIGDRAALESLKTAAVHHDPLVRREVVRALGMVGGPKAGEVLIHTLEDEDPQIRMAALRYLPATKAPITLDSLLEIVTRPDFPQRTLSERRAFFEVLAEVGQEQVQPLMIKILRRWALFKRAKNDEAKAVAAYGLGNIHTVESLEALKKTAARARLGSVLSEAVSYSIHKLSAPERADTEV